MILISKLYPKNGYISRILNLLIYILHKYAFWFAFYYTQMWTSLCVWLLRHCPSSVNANHCATSLWTVEVSCLFAIDRKLKYGAFVHSLSLKNPKRKLAQWHLLDWPFSPTNGSDHVKTSMKLGSQYGCGLQLNWRMFITLFSYFNTAAWKQKPHIEYISLLLN